MARDEGGMAAITTIALLPLLLLVLAGVLQRGALRVSAARVRSAADLAVLVAVNDQDDAELASTGRLRLASDAATVAREYFARELEMSTSLLASPFRKRFAGDHLGDDDTCAQVCGKAAKRCVGDTRHGG